MPDIDILLVEDDDLLREVLADSLSEEGLKVASTSNPECALNAIESGRPTVLVTDINLGSDIDGFGLAEAARAASPPLGVVLITGVPDNYNRYRKRGSEVLLQKPFRTNDLLKAVRGFMVAAEPAAS
jgi:two-component system OmpR family response regulator